MNIGRWSIAVIATIVLLFAGCGGGGGGGEDSPSSSTEQSPSARSVGYFKTVENAEYETSSGITGRTDSSGRFFYKDGDEITFVVAETKLGTVKAQDEINVFAFAKPDMVAQTLHALDSDANLGNGIQISDAGKLQGRSGTVISRSFENKNVKYRLDLEKIDPFSEEYWDFLEKHGLVTKPAFEAMVDEVVNVFELPKLKESNSYWRRIMRGETPAPAPLNIGDMQNIKEYYNDPSKSYHYRLKAAVSYGMYLYAQNIYQNMSADKMEEVKLNENVANEILTGVSSGLDLAFNIDTYLGDGKKHDALIRLAESGYAATTQLTVSDRYSAEAQMAGAAIFKCAPALSKSSKKAEWGEEAVDCVVDVTAAKLRDIIQQEYGETDPVAAVWANGAVDLGVNLINTVRKCKGKSANGVKKLGEEAKECVETVTKTFVNDTLKTATYTMLIYDLNEAGKDLNSFAIATEMFLARRYFAPGADLLFYNELIPLYGGAPEDAKKYEMKNILAQYAKVATLMKENPEKMHFATLTQQTKMFDVRKIEKYLELLESKRKVAYSAMIKKTEKYFIKGGGVSEAVIQNDIDRIVTIGSPFITESKVHADGSMDMRACFVVTSKKAIRYFEPTLSLVGDDVVVAELEDYEQSSGPNEKIEVCGHFRNYRPKNDATDGRFAIKAGADVTFFQSQRSFPVANLQLYDYNLEKKIYEAPSLELELERVGDGYKHYRVTPIPAGDEIPEYYTWSVGGGKTCSLSKRLIEAGPSWNIEFADECNISEIPKLTLSVSALRSDYTRLTESSRPFDFVTIPQASPQVMKAVSKDPILPVTADAPASTTIIPVGGEAPYSFSIAKAPSSVFEAGLDDQGKLTVSTSDYDAKTKNSSIEVEVRSSDGLVATVKVDVIKPGNVARGINIVKRLIEPYNYYPASPYAIENGTEMSQQWGIINTSDSALENVRLVKEAAFCDDAFDVPEIIEVGSIQPGAIQKIEAKIRLNASGEGGYYCHWGVYANIDGESKQLKWPKSGTGAKLHVFYEVKNRDDAPPVVSNFRYEENGEVFNGSFVIRQKNDKIRHLRVELSPWPYFPTGSTETVIVGDYETIQSGGEKSFSFSLNGWSRDVLYWRIGAENGSGVPMEVQTGIARLKNYKVPEVHGVSPSDATVGLPTLFEITGEHLPSTLAMSLQDGECGTVVVEADGKRASVTCTPRTAGNKRMYVAVKPGGAGVYGQDGLYIRVVDNGMGGGSGGGSESKAPILSVYGSPKEVTAGENFHIRLNFSDRDGNGKRIAVVWGDGEEKVYDLRTDEKYRSVVSIMHAYKRPGTYRWYAQAIDEDGLKSERVSAQIVVREGDASSGDRNETGNFAGKTFYLEDGTQYVFNADMSELRIVHTDGTIQNRPIEINVNGVHFLDGSGIEYLLMKEATSGYLLVENAEVTEGGVIISHNGTFKLYYEYEANGELGSLIVGKTYYVPVFDSYKDDNGSIVNNDHVETLYFDPDGVTLKISWVEKSQSHTTTLSYKVQNDTLTIYGTNSEGAVNLTLREPVDLGDSIKFNYPSKPNDNIFYKTYSAARAFLEKGMQDFDLESILPGRTMYHLHCGDGNDTWIETVGFLPGNIIAVTERGVKEERGTYEIVGNTVYTKFEDEPRDAHVAIYYDGKKIVFREEDGDTTTFYFTEADARNSEPMDCGGDDAEIKISEIVSGRVVFYDENNRTIAVPADAWVGITASRFRESWRRLNCRVDSDGNFGAVCYGEGDEAAFRAAFEDESETYQLVVYKNHVKPDRPQWNCGEDLYSYVGGNVPHGAWSIIRVYPEDYEDRSDEMCDDDSMDDDGNETPVTTQVVTGVTASKGLYPDKILVRWNPLEGVSEYQVYRCISTSIGSCEKIAVTGSNTYSDTTAMAQSTYYYRVRAMYDGNTVSEFSDYAAGRLSDSTTLPVVGRIYASKGDHVDKITIEWDAVALTDGANYELYRCSDSTIESCILLTRRTVPYYVDEKKKGLMVGEMYYYRVRIQGVGDESGEFSDYDIGYLSESPTVQTPSATQGVYGDKVLVSWPDEPSATHYQVYACNTYTVRSYEVETSPECRLVVQQTAEDNLGNRYPMADDTAADPGKKYWYFVRARLGGSWGDFSEKSNSGYRGLEQPLVPAVNVWVIDDINPTLSIMPIPPGEHGAKSYKVYRCTDASDIESCALIQETLPYISVQDSGVERKVDYYYRAKSVSYSGKESAFGDAVVGRVP